MTGGPRLSRRRIAGYEVEVAHYPPGGRRRRPPVVLLHEGLGSLARWADFPRRLASQLATDVFAYSRAGYGRSEAVAAPWPDSFMHREAHGALPQLLASLRLEAPPVLLGHSDGGSIALIYAASAGDELGGVVALAPHLFVEEVTLAGIRDLGQAWRNPRFQSAFCFHHRAGQALFDAWRDVWLRPSFRQWDLRGLITRITAPVLAIQGEEDAFGTLAQIQTLTDHLPQAERLELPGCGHAPHRSHTREVIDAVDDFLDSLPH